MCDNFIIVDNINIRVGEVEKGQKGLYLTDNGTDYGLGFHGGIATCVLWCNFSVIIKFVS